MPRKSGNRFSDKGMRKVIRMSRKSGYRFSGEDMPTEKQPALAAASGRPFQLPPLGETT
jgi:hypothetical protein